MKSALQTLEEKGIKFSLNYLGKDDLLTWYEIERIIDNHKTFEEIIDNAPYNSISDLNEYYTFLFVRKISLFSEVVPIIADEDNQRIILQLSENAGRKASAYSIGTVVKYLNDCYQDIFSNERANHSVIKGTLQLIASYQAGLSDEFFMHLIREKPIQVYTNYDRLQVTIERRQNLAAALFSEKIIKRIQRFGLETVLEVVENVYKRKPELVQEATDYLLNYGQEKANELSVESVPQLFQEILPISKFSKDIRHPLANRFVEIERRVQELIGEYLELYGQTIQKEIPLGEIVKLLRSDKPWPNKLLALTHSPNEEKTKLKCVLECKPRGSKSLVDLAASNMRVNSYFTHSHQDYIRSLLTVGGAASNLLLENKDYFQAAFSSLLNICDYLCKAFNCREEELEDGVILLSQMLGNLFLNQTVMEELVKPIAYGCEVFLCAFVEKLLRLMFLSCTRDIKFIPRNKITLGTLLQDDSNPLNDVFGEHMIKTLRFVLTSDAEDVGYNIRNDLAHLNGTWKEHLGKTTVCILFFVLMCVINSIYLYFENDINQNRQEGKNFEAD